MVGSLIRRDGISKRDLKNIFYKNSTQKASDFVVMCALASYVGLIEDRPKKISSCKTDCLKVVFSDRVDEIAAALDRKSFVDTLEKMADIQSVHTKPQRLLPLCCYGSREQIKAVISYMAKWNEWYAYGSNGTAQCADVVENAFKEKI